MINSFSGPLTFFRQPPGQDLRTVDAAVIGLPMDLAVSNRAGARFGPRSIRESSAQLAWGECWPWGFDPFDRLKVADFGDIEFEYGNLKSFRTAATQFYRDCAAKDVVPIGLGGDHHVTAAALDGLVPDEGPPPIALLQFDAHTDTTEGPDTQHGTMFGHALARGAIDDASTVRVGVRTASSEDEGLNIAPDRLMSEPPGAIADLIHERLRDRRVYITFDIDCLDPSCAPGTGTPVPGGPSTLMILRLLRSLGARCKDRPLTVIGIDLVEISTPYDHAEITSLAGCQILQELICLLTVCREAQQPG